MIRTTLTCAALLAGAATVSAKDYKLHTFRKIQLSDQFWSEGAHFGDFNHDGIPDVVSGPFWWEGPTYEKKHQYAPADKSFKKKLPDGTEVTVPGYEGAQGINNAYSDNFFAYSYDINGDGWDDIVILGFPGDKSYWYLNPKGKEGNWEKFVSLDITDNESPTFLDLTGDKKPEIVCSSSGWFGYASPDWKDPQKPWAFTKVTPKGSWQRFTHGMGVGDVNNDGRMDILEKDGWWEQPKAGPASGEWAFHKFPFSPGGGSQMFAYDVNGDGKNDVVASVAAHGYGLAWYEQIQENGQISFKEHIFVNKEPSENKYGVHFSQIHAVDLVDMDGDGLKDIVTGKRFWAHGAHGDAEPNAPSVLYWFKLVRNPDKSVDWIPYLIDDNSGVGTQVAAGKGNKDNLPDVVVGNKRGVFVFIHEARSVSKAQWEAAQPKPYTGAQ